MPNIQPEMLSADLAILTSIPNEGDFHLKDVAERTGLTLSKVKEKISRYRKFGVIEKISANRNGTVCRVSDRPNYNRMINNIKYAVDNKLEIPSKMGYKTLLDQKALEELHREMESLSDPKEKAHVQQQFDAVVKTITDEEDIEPVKDDPDDGEYADFWGEAGRPCKDIARRETLIDIAGVNAAKIRSVFDLPGIDLISTKYILDHYDCSVFAAERDHSVYKEIRDKKPFAGQVTPARHRIVYGRASEAIQKLFVHNIRPFDLVNLDFCGYYCPQTDKTLGALFGNDMINHGAFLFITLSSDYKRADYRAGLNLSYQQITGHRYEGSDPLGHFPIHVTRIAYEYGYVATLRYNKFYREPSAEKNPARPTMHVFGFQITRPFSLLERVQSFANKAKKLVEDKTKPERIVLPKK